MYVFFAFAFAFPVLSPTCVQTRVIMLLASQTTKTWERTGGFERSEDEGRWGIVRWPRVGRYNREDGRKIIVGWLNS